MCSEEWYQVPVGLDAPRWVTRRSRRTVLAIVHTVTSGQRLLDILRLLAADLRVQVVFTMGPDVFRGGVPEFLRGVGGVTLPWTQARNQRFDLAVAAAYEGIGEVHAPLVVVPHGAGFNKRVSRRLTGRSAVARGVYGLAAQELVKDGMVIPAAIALAHETELGRLAQSCPDAVPVAAVVGDPVHDRLEASVTERTVYRRALGVDDDQELVVVTSTWGSRSLFGRRAELPSQLLAGLPRSRYRVAALLHPNVWYGHGTWQIRAWLADSLRNGLALVPPLADWRGVLVAADHVVGDHGSVAAYATVTGASVLLAGDEGAEDLDPESAAGILARTAPRLRTDQNLPIQLNEATLHRHREVTDRLTSAPNDFDRNMRRLLYHQMRLPQPPTIPRAEPVPPPYLSDQA